MGKDVSQLKTRFNRCNFDLVFNDLLAKPDGLDGIVLTSRSELRRWCSSKNKSAWIVLVNSDVHGAGVGFVVILFLDSNGNANLVNEGNDGEKITAAAP